MNLGREIVACALRTKSMKAFIDAGITSDWLDSKDDRSSAAIFTDKDREAYRTLLTYWGEFGKTPSMDMFRLSYPQATYRLPDSDYRPAELTYIFGEDREEFLSQLAAMDIAEAVEAGDFKDAAELMTEYGRRIRDSRVSRNIVVQWDAPDYDLEERLNRAVEAGVRTGIEELDDEFPGFQRGNLICYLGRAKAGKSSFFILSALAAHDDGRRVLFVTFEIAAGTADTPGIADRLDTFSAGESFADYTNGDLDAYAKKRMREFRAQEMGNQGFYVVQPVGSYTVADLEYDIDKYEPDVVYIDGFYFMTDQETRESGAGWKGQDNLAGALKSLAMRKSLPVIISHQVREKQMHGKKGGGIDDGAMMGGTAIIMYADMVLGFDADDQRLHTISCTRSRSGYLPTVKGTWNWDRCEFRVEETPDAPKADATKFAFNQGSDDD